MEYHLKVIDGYKPNITSSENGVGNDMSIVFMHNHKPYITTTTFTNLSDLAVQRIKDKLFDNVSYNLNCKKECEAIYFTSIMYQIDEIIKNDREKDF